ncbi:MAG: MbcA/ParS/Xre antitoxin family protein [Ruminococcus sp.]|nr:MbcA/ParS/Xre antitoxin family protein [Ruminococcus sp.]
MLYFFKPFIKPDTKKETYDNMTQVEKFANAYNEKEWKNFVECFPETDIKVDGVSQDVVKPIVHLVGEHHYIKWLNTPIPTLYGKTAVELEQTETGRKALRAYVITFPC